MKIFLNKNTHVGTDEPADKTKTWLPQNLSEEANFLSNPATYGVLSGPRVKIAEGLDAQNIDAYGEKLRAYEVEPSTLVIKEYKNGAWVNMDLNLDVPEGLITFTIDGTSYEAEDEMTWGEWVESDYNTDGYWCYADSVSAVWTEATDYRVKNSSDDVVYSTDTIIADHSYVHGSLSDNDGSSGGAD